MLCSAPLQVAAAQLCYAVAGTPLQAWDPASRLCLLGGDHRRLPHSARSVAAFQRTEIYDWAMTAGERRPLNPDPDPVTLTLTV